MSPMSSWWSGEWDFFLSSCHIFYHKEDATSLVSHMNCDNVLSQKVNWVVKFCTKFS